ncbi:MAG: hypothetical protein FD133_1101 [Erysipelotrichaceae bacterium]|nr:MAG: hypothetical protein FD179_455 [Erysipelotrichaceae bacterium]TXT18091.1 MAG: hypothetical protein FD133_1101 [Erysipelotrichaceae bacterium]
MESLNKEIREYTLQLSQGHIQKAYRGILSFMSELRTNLERNYPDYTLSSMYAGYLDMSYFAFTPLQLKRKKLKIAIVYLHGENRFEAWLTGFNRQTQTEVIESLREKDLKQFTLSETGTGVDSIIAYPIIKRPNFNKPEHLKQQIEINTLLFIKEMDNLLK